MGDCMQARNIDAAQSLIQHGLCAATGANMQLIRKGRIPPNKIVESQKSYWGTLHDDVTVIAAP
jgi:hypothetical protein